MLMRRNRRNPEKKGNLPVLLQRRILPQDRQLFNVLESVFPISNDFRSVLKNHYSKQESQSLRQSEYILFLYSDQYLFPSIAFLLVLICVHSLSLTRSLNLRLSLLFFFFLPGLVLVFACAYFCLGRPKPFSFYSTESQKDVQKIIRDMERDQEHMLETRWPYKEPRKPRQRTPLPSYLSDEVVYPSNCFCYDRF